MTAGSSKNALLEGYSSQVGTLKYMIVRFIGCARWAVWRVVRVTSVYYLATGEYDMHELHHKVKKVWIRPTMLSEYSPINGCGFIEGVALVDIVVEILVMCKMAD